MQSKKMLLFYLKQSANKDLYKQAYFFDKTKPFLLDDKRIVEAPTTQIKKIQKRILKKIQKIDFPANVFSGVKKKSFIDNVKIHMGNNYLFKLDISKFFPSTPRDRIYKLFLNKFKMSPDVAKIMTNLSTIDFSQLPDSENKNIVNQFMLENNIKCLNHLITGSPLSPILSFLCNYEMFDELQNFCKRKNYIYTVYIDDIVISSKLKILASDRKYIINIIKKYGYKISKEKCHWYNKKEWKVVTGLIIDENGNVKPKRQLELKTKEYLNEFKHNDYNHIDNLLGCLILLNMIDKHYEKIYKMVKSKKNELNKKSRVS